MAGGGDEKIIKIKLEIDPQALQRLRQSLADVTRDFQALVQSSRGLTAGSGGPSPFQIGTGKIGNEQQLINTMKTPNAAIVGGNQGSGAMAQPFIETAAALKNLSGISRETMRVVSDVIGRAAQEQKRSLKELDSQIEGLTSKYSDLQDAQKTIGIGSQTGSYQAIGGQLGGAVQQRQAAASSLLNLEQQQKAIQNTLSPPPANQGTPASAGMFMKGAGGLLAAGQFAVNEYMGMGRASTQLGAMVGNFKRQEIMGIRGGDMTLAYGARLKQIDEENRAAYIQSVGGHELAGRDALRSQSGGFMANAEQYFGAVTGGIKGLVGMNSKPGGIGGGFYNASVETGMARNTLDMYRGFAEKNPMQLQALQDFSGSLAARISAQRLGIVRGSGRNLNGLGGSGFVESSPGTDDFGALAAKLRHDGGYDMGAYMGAYGGLRGIGGERFAYESMAAQAAGYAGYGELLTAQTRAGGSRGVLSGLNAGAALKLGQAITGEGWDPSGMTSGRGLEGAFQAGFGTSGGITDFNQVARFQAGMGGFSRFSQGQVDPFQQGRNIMSAINITPDSSIYSQDYLATGMNARQLTDLAYGGEQSVGARAHGITSGMAKEMIASTDKSLMARFVDQGGADPMSREMRRLIASGKNIHDYVGSIKDPQARQAAIENIGVFTGEHGAGGIEAGIGMIGIEAGMSEGAIQRLKKRAGLGGGYGGAEKILSESQADIDKQFSESLKGLGSELGNVAKLLPGLTKTLAAYDGTSGAADTLNRSFIALSKTINKINTGLGGQVPDLPAMDSPQGQQQARSKGD